MSATSGSGEAPLPLDDDSGAFSGAEFGFALLAAAVFLGLDAAASLFCLGTFLGGSSSGSDSMIGADVTVEWRDERLLGVDSAAESAARFRGGILSICCGCCGGGWKGKTGSSA